MAVSLQFGGLELTAAPYNVQNVEGLIGLPDVDTSDVPRVGQSGLIAGRDFYRGRSVTITLDVYADTEAAYTAAVAALTTAFGYSMVAENPLTFTVPGVAGGNPAVWYCRTRKAAMGLPAGRLGSHSGEFVVELFGTDALKYGSTAHTQSLGINVGAGGFVWPLTWPLVWLGAGGGHGTIVTNLGNVAASPTVRLLGPLVNPKMTNLGTGQVVSLNLTINDGEFVDFDYAAKTVLLNGTANRYPNLLRAEWWTLAPGNTTVVLTADSGTGTAQITWRDSYL